MGLGRIKDPEPEAMSAVAGAGVKHLSSFAEVEKLMEGNRRIHKKDKRKNEIE